MSWSRLAASIWWLLTTHTGPVFSEVLHCVVRQWNKSTAIQYLLHKLRCACILLQTLQTIGFPIGFLCRTIAVSRVFWHPWTSMHDSQSLMSEQQFEQFYQALPLVATTMPENTYLSTEGGSRMPFYSLILIIPLYTTRSNICLIYFWSLRLRKIFGDEYSVFVVFWCRLRLKMSTRYDLNKNVLQEPSRLCLNSMPPPEEPNVH